MTKTPFKYFSLEEVQGLQIALVLMLDKAREEAGIPFIITSGFRTEDQNRRIGGVTDSSHLKGLAVDLRCKTDQERYKIFKGLVLAGFNRIEIAKDHIHADIDKMKKQDIMWLDY